MSYTTDVMKLISNPDEFFSEMKSRDAKLSRPALIVLLLATLVALNQHALMSKLSEAVPEKLQTFFKIGGYIGIAGSFIGVFAVWLIIAAIMHGLSAFFEGKGDFRRTFEFTGYGFLPSLIGSLITTPMSLYYITNAEIPEISLAQLQSPDAVKAAVLSIIPRDLIYSNLIINIAVTSWSLTIWTFALRHARELELREAFICASMPTMLFAVYQVWSILKLL